MTTPQSNLPSIIGQVIAASAIALVGAKALQLTISGNWVWNWNSPQSSTVIPNQPVTNVTSTVKSSSVVPLSTAPVDKPKIESPAFDVEIKFEENK